MKVPAPITDPTLCLAYSGDRLVDSHMEDSATGAKFYILELSGPAPVQFGVHEGEPWFRWVWMWETTREADLALAKVPPEVESSLDSAVETIRQVVSMANPGQASPDRVERVSIGDLLTHIGWPMTGLPDTKAKAAAGLAIYKRLLEQRPRHPSK